MADFAFITICLWVVYYQYNHILIGNWYMIDWNYINQITNGITRAFINEITVNQLGMIGFRNLIGL